MAKEKHSKGRLGIAVVCACVVLPGEVAADTLSRVFHQDMPSVRDRFEGRGARIGQFWILPNVESGYFFDSNVFGEAVDRDSDSGIYVSPTIAVQSDFGRHELRLRGSLDHYEYFDLSSQSRTDFNGEIEGRYDVRSDIVLKGGVVGGNFSQTPADLEFPGGGAAVSAGDYYTLEAWGAAHKQFNRMEVTAAGAYKRIDYDDVDGVDQDFRDGHVLEARGRLSYAVSPGYRVFGDFRHSWREHDGGVIPDSTGWRVLGGLEFQLTHLVSGEIGAGYMQRTFDLAGSPTVAGWSYNGSLHWNPTRLMTVKLDAERTIEDSTVVQTGRVQDEAKLVVDYEVLRSLVLTGSAAVVRNDYDSSPLGDLRVNAGAGLEYRMNRRVSLGGRYKYSYTDPEGGGLGDWDRHIAGIYAKAHF